MKKLAYILIATILVSLFALAGHYNNTTTSNTTQNPYLNTQQTELAPLAGVPMRLKKRA